MPSLITSLLSGPVMAHAYLDFALKLCFLGGVDFGMCVRVHN